MFGSSAILAFHQISTKFFPGINNIKPENFWILLELLKSWGLIFWNGERLGKKNGSNYAVLTFDDGYYDQYDLFLRLTDIGIRPIVFIPTAYIGKENSWEYSSRIFPSRHLDAEQIRNLARRGVIIGSHGASHRSLTNMSTGLARQEMVQSREILEDITERNVEFISFPFGQTNRNINKTARECGYRHGFALTSVKAGESGDNFVLSRIPVYGIDDYYSLKAAILGNSTLEKLKKSIINNLAAGTIITSRKLK